jgi:hypothetical protein
MTIGGRCVRNCFESDFPLDNGLINGQIDVDAVAPYRISRGLRLRARGLHSTVASWHLINPGIENCARLIKRSTAKLDA